MVDEELRACSEEIGEGRVALVRSLKRYSLSIGTQGSSWRRRASSSLRRVSSFSALSSFSPATSQSSRVPVLWSSSFLSFLGRADPATHAGP